MPRFSPRLDALQAAATETEKKGASWREKFTKLLQHTSPSPSRGNPWTLGTFAVLIHVLVSAETEILSDLIGGFNISAHTSCMHALVRRLSRASGCKKAMACINYALIRLAVLHWERLRVKENKLPTRSSAVFTVQDGWESKIKRASFDTYGSANAPNQARRKWSETLSNINRIGTEDRPVHCRRARPQRKPRQPPLVFPGVFCFLLFLLKSGILDRSSRRTAGEKPKLISVSVGLQRAGRGRAGEVEVY